MTNEILLIIFSLYVTLSLVISFVYHRREARAAEREADFEEKHYMLDLRLSREGREEGHLPGGAYGWLKRQVQAVYGYAVEFVPERSITLTSTPVLVAQVAKGDRLIISPLKRSALRRRLKRLMKEQGRLANLTEESTVLDLANKARQEERIALDNKNVFFDIEAQKVAEALDTGWGDPDQLYMYWVKA